MRPESTEPLSGPSAVEPVGHPSADGAPAEAAEAAEAALTPIAALPVAAVARRLGVAPATLRTWARRYDLGPSAHAAGAHRRYGPSDVARLETMRRLTMDGVPPAEAARIARTDPPQQPSGAGPLPDREGRMRRGAPGGRVLAMPGADAVVRGLGRAAMALDSRTVTATVRQQLSRHGTVHTWDHVLRPVLAAAGARWASTGEGVEVEHLLSDCVTATLREVAETAPERSGARPVLLAGAPEEQHALPLHAVAAGLAERGVASRVLGPSMPTPALAASVRRTGAAALFIWAQWRGTAASVVVEDLPLTRPPTALVVGGPGWTATELPERVSMARDLSDAVDLVSRAAGA